MGQSFIETTIREWLEPKGFDICPDCRGKGETVRFPWDGQIAKCGTCQSSGLLPLRGFYYVTEEPVTLMQLLNRCDGQARLAELEKRIVLLNTIRADAIAVAEACSGLEVDRMLVSLAALEAEEDGDGATAT